MLVSPEGIHSHKSILTTTTKWTADGDLVQIGIPRRCSNSQLHKAFCRKIQKVSESCEAMDLTRCVYMSAMTRYDSLLASSCVQILWCCMASTRSYFAGPRVTSVKIEASIWKSMREEQSRCEYAKHTSTLSGRHSWVYDLFPACLTQSHHTQSLGKRRYTLSLGSHNSFTLIAPFPDEILLDTVSQDKMDAKLSATDILPSKNV